MTQIDSSQFGKVPAIEMLATEPIVIHSYYSLLLKDAMPSVNCAREKWESDFDIQLSSSWREICTKNSLMVQIKMRSFYIRYINCTFHLNYLHSKYMPDVSPKCTFCKQEDERFMHLFWYCCLLVKFRIYGYQLINWCKKNVSDQVEYSQINCLILGFKIPVLDMIMTICKYHIYLLKHYIGLFNFTDLLNRINSIRIKDRMSYKELPYLSIYKIKKCWSALTQKNFS